MLMMFQFWPLRFAVPHRRLPSGDQNICWNIPRRGNSLTGFLVARSKMRILPSRL